MTEHIAWAAVEFLLNTGWTIVDPGLGRPRIASKNGIEFELEPRCECEYCPQPPEHPNYRHIAVGEVTSAP